MGEGHRDLALGVDLRLRSATLARHSKIESAPAVNRPGGVCACAIPMRIRKKGAAFSVLDLGGGADLNEGRVSGQWRAMGDGSDGIPGSDGNVVSVSCGIQTT